jgi:hypothetical protein
MGDSIEDLITGLAPLFGGDRAKAATELDSMREAAQKILQEQRSNPKISAPALNMGERRELENLEIDSLGKRQDLSLKGQVDLEETGLKDKALARKLKGLRGKTDMAIQLQQLPAETLLKLQQGQVDMLDRVNRQKNTANMINNILKGAALFAL